MALTRVQATGKVHVAGSTSIALTFGATPSVGNAVLVLVHGWVGSPFSSSGCVDNQGNTYSLAVTTTGAAVTAAIYYCAKIATASGTFTITVTSPAAYNVAAAVEIGGVGPGLAVDHTTFSTGTSTALATGSTGALAADEVVIAAVGAVNANQASITVESVSPAWTEEYEELNHSAYVAGEGDTRIRTGVGGTTQSCSWTAATSNQWAAAIAVFASPTITGTAAITLGALTLSATGTVEDQRTGTAAITLGALTLSATGTVTSEITGTAAITLGALTLSATGTVESQADARISQLPLEVATAPAGSSLRVSQTPVEVIASGPGALQLSQAIVEILLPAPGPVTPVIASPGIAWVEWRGRVPAALARDAPAPLDDTLETVVYSDWDLQCPPDYYHGFKAARVESFGIASRTLSEARTGDWQGSTMEIHLSDYDRFLRTTLATTPGRFGQDSLVIVRMVSREVRAELGEPLTIFAGPIRRADPVGPLSFALLLEDAVGHGMLNDEHLIPQRLIDASDWTDVEVVDAAKGRPVPIVYGVHARPAGAFVPIYLGIEDGTDHLWLVAGHYAAVTDIFVDGVSALGGDPADWTIPGRSGAAYEEVAGRRYTLLRGRVGVPAGSTDPVLYAENAGAGASTFETWIASYPLGGMPPGVGVRWDVNGTTTPHAGSRCLEGVDLREGELVKGTFGVTGPPGTAVPRGYQLDEYDNLLVWVLNGTNFWPVGVALEFAFYVNPFGDPVGSFVLVSDGLYGFDETNVTTWQLVTIPIADFAPGAGERSDYLVIRKTGTDEITVSLDDISLESAVGSPEADLTPADRVARGESVLTVNLTGWTTTGDDDDDGEVITAIADEYQHFLINYVANPAGYQTGASLSNPTIDLFDRTVDTVLEDSFAAAKAAGLARYPPDGYLGAAILGASSSDRRSVREWIATWNRSADCRFGVTRYGELGIWMTDPTSADEDAAILLDETLDTLEGTFTVDVQWESQATRIPFVADYDYVAGVFRVSRDAEDAGLSATYGRPAGIPGSPRQYDFIRDSDQAKNVGEHEVQRVGNPPRVLIFETALGPLTSQELGSYIRVRHYAGVGPDVERLCQIEELAIVVDPRHVRVRAVDVTGLIDATTPDD